MLARGVHEGGVDVESMSTAKIASIIARMQSDLREPELSEGFDEVLRVEGDGLEGSSSKARQAVLERIWALAGGGEEPG